MRLPNENYIRFLITNGLDSEETNEELQSLGFRSCPVDYWDKQYKLLQALKLPKQIKKFWKNPRPKFPAGFLEYMATIDLKEAWLYNVGKSSSFGIAVDVAKDEDVRLVVQALLVRRADRNEIAAIINGKFGMAFPAEAVKLFEQYFFQVRIMSRDSWKAYLKTVDQEIKIILYKALSGKETEMRADLGVPTKISVSERYQKLHIQAMAKFEQLTNSNDPDTDAQALKWAALAMSAGDKYEKLKLGDASDFGKDLQMEFEYIDTNFPSIGEDAMDQIHDTNELGKKADNHDPIPLKLSDESNEES